MKSYPVVDHFRTLAAGIGVVEARLAVDGDPINGEYTVSVVANGTEREVVAAEVFGGLGVAEDECFESKMNAQMIYQALAVAPALRRVIDALEAAIEAVDQDGADPASVAQECKHAFVGFFPTADASLDAFFEARLGGTRQLFVIKPQEGPMPFIARAFDNDGEEVHVAQFASEAVARYIALVHASAERLDASINALHSIGEMPSEFSGLYDDETMLSRMANKAREALSGWRVAPTMTPYDFAEKVELQGVLTTCRATRELYGEARPVVDAAALRKQFEEAGLREGFKVVAERVGQRLEAVQMKRGISPGNW